MKKWMRLEERTLGQDYIFHGRVFNVRVDDVELPNSRVGRREVIEHLGGVCVAALTEDDQLLFVKQFRYPYMEVTEELPAGKCNPGEYPVETALRELREETGATAAHLEWMGQLYPTPGYCGEIIHLFFATGLTIGEPHPDADEFLELERIPLQKAVERVMAGELPDAKTQTLVLKVERLVRERRERGEPVEGTGPAFPEPGPGPFPVKETKPPFDPTKIPLPPEIILHSRPLRRRPMPEPAPGDPPRKKRGRPSKAELARRALEAEAAARQAAEAGEAGDAAAEKAADDAAGKAAKPASGAASDAAPKRKRGRPRKVELPRPADRTGKPDGTKKADQTEQPDGAKNPDGGTQPDGPEK